VSDRRAAWIEAFGTDAPIDAVTTSGSGLDPHISPEAALAQADRIAATRQARPESVRALIETVTEGRFLGLYGEPRVNVLLANMALDVAFPMSPAGQEGQATE
jgi:potassium-transporting ATPase KdpC subunit